MSANYNQDTYALAHLTCNCTVMQRREENPGLFYLLHRLENRSVTLYCPEHRRQGVTRLITRTQRRAHWPRFEMLQCAHCHQKMSAPPPPAEGDEATMPGAAYGRDSRHGVYIRCPGCQRWSNYSYAGTAEDRYDTVWKKVACPECSQETLVSYNPFTTPIGEQIRYSCLSCRKHFAMVFSPKSQENKP